ncbi:FAS1 domain-containing protein SELMODRAFT_448915-like [Chenopodium quinoa]|uniref:FAS1 domain-containing protein SELMODRAFT_448915-like n=1 Tax=Chenopodium quinoa TaxID=63459 RepID=UPI000B787EFE|nr:FAS1 domain-containing protein SELMODRAFT_448915-like [Chenopodium quinoa]
MASFFILSLLFLLNFSTTVTSAIEINFTTFNIAPTPSPSPPSSPPPLPSLSVIARPPPAQVQETPQQLQFNSIIDSIVGAGDFSNWAKLLSQADPSIFPLTATLFIPEDGAFLAGNSTSPASSFNPLLFYYHIVPRRFTFTELRQFPNGARLPTLLPGKTILITNNSAGNFSVNGALLTHPDLFQSSVVSVHGIGTVLDYNTSGDDFSSPENFLGRNPSPENMLGGVPSPPLPEFEQDRRGPVVGSPKNVASSAARNLQKLISELLDNM